MEAQKINNHLVVATGWRKYKCKQCGHEDYGTWFEDNPCETKKQNCVCENPYKPYVCPIHWYTSQEQMDRAAGKDLNKSKAEKEEDAKCELYAQYGYHQCRCGKKMV